MPASGSSMFADADRYQVSLEDMLDLLVLDPRDFRARLTWVELPTLHLLRAQENSARVAYVQLPPEEAFVTFLIQQGSSLFYGGAELRFGDLIFHSVGERGHQRMSTASRWGSISLKPASLWNIGETIAGRGLAPPSDFRILRPPASDWRQCLQLHAQAGRLAEANLDRIGNKEIVRALEQDLILALATCLTTADVSKDQTVRRDHVTVLLQLEQTLAAHPHRLLRTQDICRSIGVSEQILRAACRSVLGMTADHYQRLRRLKLARKELMRAGTSGAVSSVEVIKRYGFADLHRFVADYWDVYGEMPPIPPREPARRET